MYEFLDRIGLRDYLVANDEVPDLLVWLPDGTSAVLVFRAHRQFAYIE